MYELFNEITQNYPKTDSDFILDPLLTVLQTDTSDTLIINGNYFMLKAMTFMDTFDIKIPYGNKSSSIKQTFTSIDDKRFQRPTIFTKKNIFKYTSDMVVSFDFLRIISINKLQNIVLLIDQSFINDGIKIHAYDIKTIIDKSNLHGFLFVYCEEDCDNNQVIKSFSSDMKNGFELHDNLIKAFEQYKSK